MAGQGAQVLDADSVGHALIDQTPAREEVVARFGEEVLDASSPSPTIDRKALAARVFKEHGSLKSLEAILHPRMRRTFEKAIARAGRRREASAVVLDAAVLFEAGWDDLCDVVVFVDAPPEVREARVKQSRGWSAEAMADREKAQMPIDTKRAKSDFVLENASDEAALSSSLEPLWQKLIRRPDHAPSRSRRHEPSPPDTP